ncbi:MAG: methyltransferase domain-containing protein [Mycobacteriales bacterium]
MPEVQKDQTMPDGAWKFDESVATVFDDMLARSIPQYEEMRRLVFEFGCRFVQSNTAVVDLGCSRGEALTRLVDRFGAQNQFVGIDVSEPMLEAARSRFKGYIDASIVRVKNLDLRTAYPEVRASLTLCVLTLQFTPIEYRQKIVRKIFEHTNSGGALILVEKVLGGTASMDDVLVAQYYALKRDNGYTQDQIDRKRLSLEGVLVPVTAKWNEEILAAAGFREVECFWRWSNFAGWLAVK